MDVKKREIKTPAITRKLNLILQSFPLNSLPVLLAAIQANSVRFEVISTASKNATLYKSTANEFEHWADGYVSAGGREVSIVAGLLRIPDVNYVGDPVVGESLVLIMVHDFPTFRDEMIRLSEVANVQVT